MKAITQVDLPGTTIDMLSNAHALESQFRETAEQYMHNETTLAFLSTVQNAPGIPTVTREACRARKLYIYPYV